MRWWLATALSLVASQAASDFSLRLPVDCELGETCHIQNYVDHLPEGEIQDFHCGLLSYDGHRGTDFALATLAEMRRGVAVLAAAPGVVRGARDGMEDRRYTPDAAHLVEDRECGNGLVIEHENGWETQYCHLRKGSLRIQPGDRVEAGAVLGEIGLSGKTQFPHVHLSVRKDGRSVDPFVPHGAAKCGPSETTLWDSPIGYVPGGLLSVGFAGAVPSYEAVLDGSAATRTLSTTSSALVLYGHAFGNLAGDILRLEVTGPQGNLFREKAVLEKPQAQLYRAFGRRLSQTSWPAGTYLGIVSMERDGKIIGQKSTTLLIR